MQKEPHLKDPDSSNAPMQDLQSAEETAPKLRSDSDEVQVEIDLQDLIDKVQQISDERDQLRDQLLRAMADFQNFKKRNQTEMALYRQMATENFAKDLLPVLDNFERSLSHLDAGAKVETIIEGVRAVERQLRQVLESQNIKRIDSVGQPFDPSLHEALSAEDTEEHPHDTVTTEIEPGYKMGEKVIRPAKVRVAKRGE